jgi:hypothetical protein
MSGRQLTFAIHDDSGVTKRDAVISTLVVAGWTGRDERALSEHIEELEALGVAPPKSVPIFYRVDANLLTSADRIQVVGEESSGEVEAVLVKLGGELFVGVGSDHTDRKLEAVGITLSKQVCAKPLGSALWRWRDVADHWDSVRLSSQLPSTNQTYQDGGAASLRRPDDLLALYEGREGPLPDGAAMFCGTLPAEGGIRFADQMALALTDPVLGRSLRHVYAVDVLPVAEA